MVKKLMDEKLAGDSPLKLAHSSAGALWAVLVMVTLLGGGAPGT